MTTTTQTKRLGIKPHLSIKRAELIWALSEQQYNETEIGSIFNISKQRVNIIISQRPFGWRSPWIKI